LKKPKSTVNKNCKNVSTSIASSISASMGRQKLHGLRELLCCTMYDVQANGYGDNF